jgi:hypothetical protein
MTRGPRSEVRYLVTLTEPESGKAEQRILDAIEMIKGVVRVEVIWPKQTAAGGEPTEVL